MTVVEVITESERILNARNIDWEIGEIPLSSIDFARSLMFNPREDAGGLSEYWVETYAQAYKNKEELPPIIVMRSAGSSKKLLVLSGNHRVAAANKAGRKTLPGYTIDHLPDHLRIDVITEANRTVGYGLTETQRIEAALHHVRFGSTAAEAARRVGADEGRVRRQMAQAVADQRLQKTTSRWTQIEKNSRVRLGSVSSDDLYKKCVDLTLAAHLGGNEINALIRDVNKAKTDKQREDVIASMWDVYRIRIETGGKKAPKTASQGGWMGLVRSSITRISNPEVEKMLDEILLAPRKDFAERVIEAHRILGVAVEKLQERERGSSK